MMKNDPTFQSELENLYFSLRKFYEKYSCSACYIAIFDQNNELFMTSSFSTKKRIEFLEYTINFIENANCEDEIINEVPKFDN